MTLQQIFDQSVTGLRRQGQKSSAMRAGIQTCLYRGPDALKCAIGHLIPDRVYREEMENRNPFNLCEESPYLRRLFTDCDLTFLAELQVIHDQTMPEGWEEKWECLALRWNLTMPRKPVSRTKKKS